MRLIKLNFKTSSDNGWVEEKFSFGDSLTNVHGPNTSGKTPLLKSIMFCLGVNIKLPQDFISNFVEVELLISISDKIKKITREISNDFEASIEDIESGIVTNYDDYGSFSEDFFTALSIPRINLTGKGGGVSQKAYVDTLFPLIYADQDFGWGELYTFEKYKDFIKAQSQEMIRIILGFKGKYPYKDKKHFEAEKNKAKANKEAISIKRELLKQLGVKKTDVGPSKVKKLKEEKQKLESKLNEIGEKISNAEKGKALYNDSIDLEEAKILTISQELTVLEAKKDRLLNEFADLNSEVDILEDNEEVNLALKSFCGNKSCSIFKTESFGKRLLYLKDQQKDLQSVLDTVNEEIKEKVEERKEFKDSLETLVDSNISEQSSSSKQLILLNKDTVNKLVKVERKLAELQEYTKFDHQLNELLKKKEQIEENLELLKPAKAKTNSIQETELSNLSSIFSEWLRVLDYGFNSVKFDLNLDLFIDEKQFVPQSEQSGSRRHRVVLAFYASLLEYSLAFGGNHPNILILDGIRQHEIEIEDIKSYVKKLGSLGKKYDESVQLVFSISEENFTVNDLNDFQNWYPRYLNNNKVWYFGKLEDKSSLKGFDNFVLSTYLSRLEPAQDKSKENNILELIKNEFHFKEAVNETNLVNEVSKIATNWKLKERA